MENETPKTPQEQKLHGLKVGVTQEQVTNAENTLLKQTKVVNDQFDSLNYMLSREKREFTQKQKTEWNELKPQLVMKIFQEQSYTYVLFMRLASLYDEPLDNPHMAEILSEIERGLQMIGGLAMDLGLVPRPPDA